MKLPLPAPCVDRDAARVVPGRRAWLRRAGALALGAAGGPWAGGARAQAQVIVPQPPLRLEPASAPDLEGRTWSLPPVGTPSVLNFWASWCEPCRAEMPTLVQLARNHGPRLNVLAVNYRQHAAVVARFAAQLGMTMPVLLDQDGVIARQWDVRVFPATLGFSADARLIWRVHGEFDWAGSEAAALVARLSR